METSLQPRPVATRRNGRRRAWLRALPALCALLAPTAPLRAQAQAAAMADSVRVYDLTEVEQPPRAANLPELQAALAAGYPPSQLQARTAGTVLVSFVVQPDGTVRDPSVVQSTDTVFDGPTITAVAALRFSPAQVGGRAVPVRAQMNIQWQPPRAAQAVEDEGAVSSAGRTAQGEPVYAMSPVVASGRVYEMSEVDVEPRPRNLVEVRRRIERAYPPHLRDRRMGAMVHVRLRVDREGMPQDLRVTRTSNAEFNAPTLESLMLLRFRPGRVDGKPVDVWMDLPIEWRVAQD
jgi:TonB family protein